MKRRADKLCEGDIVNARCGCRLRVEGFERYPLSGERRVLMRLVKLCPGVWRRVRLSDDSEQGCMFFGERRAGSFLRIAPSQRFDVDEFASVLSRSFGGPEENHA